MSNHPPSSPDRLRRFAVVTGLTALGLAAAARLYSMTIEPNQLRIERLRLALPRLPKEFDGYCIVQLSDLHFGPALALPTVLRGIELTQALAPDLIVLTGDLTTYWLEEDRMVHALRQLAAPDGVYAILGNHDHYASVDTEGLRFALERAGVVELRNRHVRIERDGAGIYLAGVDDILFDQGDLMQALDGIPDGAATVLLAHEPDYADLAASTGKVDVQLSGHTHGGQIVLFGQSVVKPLLQLGVKYISGLYRVPGPTRDMALYTSRGLGRGPLLRWNAPPEITEIRLIAGSPTE
ncbi:MAG: metallophosphoesterase [Chloroflexi bacterium]|nr:metallophosphoesterase [Chloroflexota bacterium]